MAAPPMDSRLHLALKVSDLERSIEFYQLLFNEAPDKVKSGYARFNLNAPPVVLTLNEGEKVKRGNRLDHMGIRLEDPEAMATALKRLKDAGSWIKEQPDVVCCHSRQSKFWVKDPDGVHWEFYVLVDDMQGVPEEQSAASTCGEE